MNGMDKLEFMRWCAAAVAGIRYKPDRERVYDELYAHLEDRCAAMADAGVPEGDAVRRALAAMGSASEAAEQLAKIHRPFWGYLLRTARWLLLISAVIALFTVPRWMLRQEMTKTASRIFALTTRCAAGLRRNDYASDRLRRS